MHSPLRHNLYCYFCLSMYDMFGVCAMRRPLEIDQVIVDACVCFPPLFSSFLHPFARLPLCTNFDPGTSTLFLFFSLSFSLASPSASLCVCVCVSGFHRALEHCDLSHGNRYSARGYRTLISSSASHSHIVDFADVETVHRTVSFGYSRCNHYAGRGSCRK